MGKTVASVFLTRTLTPDDTEVRQGQYRMLEVDIRGDRIYKGVFAVQSFPFTSPRNYISLFWYDEEERIKEIGMIEDVSLFPRETQDLIVQALNRYYFVVEIIRVKEIEREFGMLFFEVETEYGPRKFTMRWEQNAAVDFGKNGKLLFDLFEDRYVIPDVDELSGHDRELFTRYIYW